jgi:hypothetical protein
MMTVVNENVLPSGASKMDVANAAATLHAAVLAGDEAVRVNADFAWLSVIGLAAAQAAGDGVTVKVREFAAALHKAHQRAGGGSRIDEVFDVLPPLTQLAWEAVARYAAWAVGEDAAARGGHTDGADHLLRWAFDQVARRGITR